MSNPPKRIWLQLNGDADPEIEGWTDCREDTVTWCWEQIFEYDVEYIHIDEAAPEVLLNQKWGGHEASEVADLVDMLVNRIGRGEDFSHDEAVSILIRARGCIRDYVAHFTQLREGKES